MSDELLTAIIRNGGFAVLSLVFGYLGFRGAQMWVTDVKAAAERERVFTEKVLDLVHEMTQTLASNTSKMEAMIGELAGLRAGIHHVTNTLGIYEKRIFDLERRVAERRRARVGVEEGGE